MCPFHYITLFSVHQFWVGGNSITYDPSQNTDPSGESAPVSFVKNIQASSSDGRINFVAAHEVAADYTLLERGVLMSDTLYDDSVFKITHEGIIKGKIENSTDEATGIYMVSKGSLSSGATWYGRAYMIVKDNTNETVTVIYADDIISGTYTPEA